MTDCSCHWPVHRRGVVGHISPQKRRWESRSQEGNFPPLRWKSSGSCWCSPDFAWSREGEGVAPPAGIYPAIDLGGTVFVRFTSTLSVLELSEMSACRRGMKLSRTLHLMRNATFYE